MMISRFVDWLFLEKSGSDQKFSRSAHEIGIAFSGGSARGFAHIGVLKALEECGVKPSIVSGTSMGAIIGLLYSAGFSSPEIQDIVKRGPLVKMVRVALLKHGFFELKGLRRILEEVIKINDFSNLKKPFYLSVTNLNKGVTEVISHGPLFDFVIASCSVPVVFAPVEINGTTYIDGGLFDNLPAESIRDKCKFLIGVNVNPVGHVSKFDGIKEIAERSFSLGIATNVIVSKVICDIVIEPPSINQYTFWDFDKVDKIVEAGYRHTMELLSEGKLKVPFATTP